MIKTGPRYFSVETVSDTLMNPEHSHWPTLSYAHNSTHTFNATLLIAPPLFPCIILASIWNVCAHTTQCTHTHITQSPDTRSSSLMWAELGQSHRHLPLSKGELIVGEVWPWYKWQKARGSEAAAMFIDLALTRYLPPTQEELRT